MSSFYGGKQGRTYHIVARYDCVNLNNYIKLYGTDFVNFSAGTSYEKGNKVKNDGEYYFILTEGTFSSVNELTNEEKAYRIRGMVQLFAKGGAYTEANYGEYVLIDTIFNLNHKSDLENGLLYRRGFDYNEDPNLNPKPNINEKDENDNFIYYDKDNHLKKDLWQAAWDAWVQKPGAGAIYVGQIVGPQGESPELTPIKWEELNPKAGRKIAVPSSITKGNNQNQVIDSEGNIVTNEKGEAIWAGDAIKVGSYTIRDSDNNIIGAEIAFDIPKDVFVISAQSVDAYGNNSRLHIDNISGATQTVQINATQDNVTKEWKYTNLINEHLKSGFLGGHPFYHNLDIAIPKGIHGRDVELLKNETVEEINQDTNNPITIDGVNVFPGDLYITYTTRDYQGSAIGAISKHLGRWPYRVINNISLLNHERTFFTFRSGAQAKVGDLYNFNETSTTGNLICAICIQAGEVNPSELPMIKPNGDSNQYSIGFLTQSNESWWRVIEISTTAPASSMTIDYKAGPSEELEDKLRNIDFLSVDKKGNLYAKYSDNPNQYFYLTSIRLVDLIELQNQDNIEQPQKIIAKYKDGSEQNITNNLNTILAIDMQGDNIIALYSDPVYRQNFRDNNDENIDWILKDWTDPVTNISYKNLVWINLTSSKGPYHVQGEYTYSDLKGSKIGDEDFTIDLSNGFGAIQGLEDRIGWLVTIQDGDTKRIFAFDDFKDTQGNRRTHEIGPVGNKFQSHWYEIFALTISDINPIAFMDISDSQPILNNNGLWFVTYQGHDNI